MSCCIIISCTKNIHPKNRSFSRIKYLVLNSLLVALQSNDSIVYNSLTPLLENTQMECICVGDDWMNGIAKLFHVAPHSQPKGAAATTNPISSKSSIPIELPQNLQTFVTLWWRNLPMSYYPRIIYKFQTYWSLIIQMSWCLSRARTAYPFHMLIFDKYCCMTIQQVRMVATIFYM